MSNKEITRLTFDKYKKYLTAYPIFGELKVKITNMNDGYKIEVKDKDICEYTDSEGNLPDGTSDCLPCKAKPV